MTSSKPSTTFWIIAVIALLWNLMGVFQFLASTALMDAMSDSFAEEEIELLNSLPSWYTIVFAIAVFAGLLGAILLLARKKAAKPLFLVSMIAVLIQMGYWLFATEVIATLGIEAAIMPMVVIAIAIFLYFFSKGAVQKGWLR